MSEKKYLGVGDVEKDWRYKVIDGETSCMKVGDIVKPIKVIGGKWQIGHNYRQSLPFVYVDKVTAECVSRLNGKLMARIERIK